MSVLLSIATDHSVWLVYTMADGS